MLTRESTAADGVAIAVRENGQFVCRASQGFAPEPGVVVEPGQGVCGRCVIDARVLVCQDLSGDVKSALAAPVIVGDEIEGLIAAFSFRTGGFDSAQIDLMSRIAVDIGNQLASPETIHLVPRDPVSILNDPRVDVVAIDDSESSSREKHLDILGAVTAPALPAVPDAAVEPPAPLSPAAEAQANLLESSPFHFSGYEDAPAAEPNSAHVRQDLLGEYLSKWDIVVIFGAVLIAMVAFSLWVHHRRAQANQPYTAVYTDDTPASQSAPPIKRVPADETKSLSDAQKTSSGQKSQPEKTR